MPNSHINLETLISQETLKKSLAGVVIVFIILFSAAVIYVVIQNNKSHQQSIVHLIDKIDNTLLNFQQQIENLASNDLIINSIVDDTNQDNYLPIFFRSLKLNNSANSSIVFSDYSGKIITGKNITIHQKFANKFNWQEKVLEHGHIYFDFSEHGILAAAPVLFADSPEGAIISYLPNLQELIPVSQNSTTFIYINNNNKVLYSSNNTLIPNGSIFKENQFQFWSKSKQNYLTGQIISLEPALSAFGNILWLAIFIIVSLICMFLGLMANVRSTAKYAAKSMNELQQTLAQAITQNGKTIELSTRNNEPIEFIAIRKAFNQVLNNLFNQTISLQKFTRVINSLGEILLVLDDNQNIILNNHSFTQFCENIGVSIPQDVDKILPDIKGLTTRDENTKVEISYPAKNLSQSTIAIRWRSADYINDKGEKLGRIFVGKDITAAKKLEVDLLIKNQAIDSAETPIIITDAEHSELPIIYTNKAFTKLTGYAQNEVIGKNCRFLQGENTKADDIAKIKTAIKLKKSLTLTLTNYKKDGSEFKNELTISPISNEYGIVTHFLGIQLDVTEREATENYLKLAKQKAEESTQLKSEFLASMSHEIRTPMNGVIGMLDLLLMSELNSEQQHNAEIAKDSANSLLTIINDILDFSKIESGKLEIENTPFDLLALFSHIAKAHAQQAHDKNLELIIDTTDIEISKICGDAGRIRQILNNLISNAIKFTDIGQVTVTAELTICHNQKAKLICHIEDTGIGIAKNRLAHVFDSFTQADSSTTRLYGGTGLGLAITEKLCQLMHGSIRVKSKKNTGSCFSFEVQLELIDDVEQPIKWNLDKHNILILDNEFNSSHILSKQLKKWGAHVVVENHSDNYNKHIEKYPYNIVFIDSSFTNTANKSDSVIELVKSLPQEYKDKMSFILMTKVNENQDKALLTDIGFRHYFSKPITPFTLNNALEEVLNNKQPINLKSCHEPLTALPLTQEKIPLLLVEDNRINQLVAKKVLLELGGDVTIANNGQEAIDILKANKSTFKLIFMDCQMPILDGYQATEQIRAGAAGEVNKTLPIIAMTANAMKGDKEKCLLHGMDDYISKPIKVDTIREKVALWLS